MVVHYSAEPQIEDISQRLLREAIPNPSQVLENLVRRGFEQSWSSCTRCSNKVSAVWATWRSNWISVTGKPSACWGHEDCARQTCNLSLVRVYGAHALREKSICHGHIYPRTSGRRGDCWMTQYPKCPIEVDRLSSALACEEFGTSWSPLK
jgi:hypothetical protein